MNFISSGVTPSNMWVGVPLSRGGSGEFQQIAAHDIKVSWKKHSSPGSQDGVLPGNPRPLASLRGSENLGRSEWLQGFGVVKKFCMFLMNSLLESGSCDLRSMPSFDAWFSGTFFSTI